jgi:hypothetical protein
MNPISTPLLADGEGALVGAGIAGVVLMLVYVAVIVLVIASLWKVFAKAGKPGWAAIVPIYNTIVLLEIVGKPLWWIILFMIPCTAPIVAIIVAFEVANVFGRGVGTGIGLIILPFIFYPILAFGSAKYQGAPQTAAGM